MTGREVGKEMAVRAFGGLLLALALSFALLPVPPAAGEMTTGSGEKQCGGVFPDVFRRGVEGRIFGLPCHNAHGPFLSPTRAYAAQEPANRGAPAGTKPVYRTYYTRRSDPGRGFGVLCEGCHGKEGG